MASRRWDLIKRFVASAAAVGVLCFTAATVAVSPSHAATLHTDTATEIAGSAIVKWIELPSSVSLPKKSTRYVLGSGNGDEGYGTPRPKELTSGNASTSYFNLRWKNWGQAVTTAVGRTHPHSPPYEQVIPGRVVGSRLKRCGSRHVYTRVTLYKQSEKSGFTLKFSCSR